MLGYTASAHCGRCRSELTLEGVGKWRCAAHSGPLYDRRWTCCGRHAGAAGCEPCDCGPPRPPVSAIDLFARQIQEGVQPDVSMPGLCVMTWKVHWGAAGKREADSKETSPPEVGAQEEPG